MPEDINDLRKLVEENIALTNELKESVSQIRRHLMWQRIFGTIYVVVLIGPIVLAVIYLPPLIRPYLDQYQALLNTYAPPAGSTNTITVPRGDVENLIQQYQMNQNR